MKLFGSRKEKEELPKKAVPSSEASAAPFFSPRLEPVFSRLYRMVLSVDPRNNVYRIELGDPSFFGMTFVRQGFYDQWFAGMAGRMEPFCRDTFRKKFGRNELLKAFEEGQAVVQTVISFADDLKKQTSFELRLEKVPMEAGRNLGILYLRCLEDREAMNVLSGQADEENPMTEVSGDVTGPILRNCRAMTFLYDEKDDLLQLFRYQEGKTSRRTTEHYLAALDQRGDWTVFHEDVIPVKTLFRQALNGNGGQAEIRYRANGVYSADFEHYKVYCTPEPGKNGSVCGLLIRAEEEYLLKQQEIDLSVQIAGFLDELHLSMYEISLDSNRISKIVRTNEGFRKEKTPQLFTQYVQKRIESEAIAPESADYYRKLLEPGVLQQKTAGGRYEFESCQKIEGSSGYRWYSETFTRKDQNPNHFYRYRRDITELRASREKEYLSEEKMRYEAYNHSMLDAFASLVEFRNTESGDHINHVRMLTRILIRDVARRSPQYELTQKQMDLYIVASAMHDIGKITIPDRILNKQGRYTPEERQMMKDHTTNGALIVDKMNMAGDPALKACCRDVALHHHERYDGSGYPDGLVGDEISIGVQVIGLADAYDALVSERVYKEKIPSEQAKQMIIDGKCGSFNSRLLESFKACLPEMEAVYKREE